MRAGHGKPPSDGNYPGTGFHRLRPRLLRSDPAQIRTRYRVHSAGPGNGKRVCSCEMPDSGNDGLDSPASPNSLPNLLEHFLDARLGKRGDDGSGSPAAACDANPFASSGSLHNLGKPVSGFQ